MRLRQTQDNLLLRHSMGLLLLPVQNRVNGLHGQHDEFLLHASPVFSSPYAPSKMKVGYKFLLIKGAHALFKSKVREIFHLPVLAFVPQRSRSPKVGWRIRHYVISSAS